MDGLTVVHAGDVSDAQLQCERARGVACHALPLSLPMSSTRQVGVPGHSSVGRSRVCLSGLDQTTNCRVHSLARLGAKRELVVRDAVCGGVVQLIN
jgi:hypothetical protein